MQMALSTLFSWAIDRGYADANPLTRLKRRTKGNSRTRVLSFQELVAIWQAAADDDFGDIVRLLTLTLQRRTEISDLQWDEIDLSSDAQINLPEERTKNGLAHSVPLSGQADTILRTRKRRHGRQYVFGDGQRGFQGWSKAKRRLDISACRICAPEFVKTGEGKVGECADKVAHGPASRPIEGLGYQSTDDLLHSIIPHWTLHDLRRTGATMMNEFGLAEPHIIEAVLNHISGASKGGVAGVYNRARYDAQKRVGLERWGTFVMTAVDTYKKAGFPAVKEFERREKQKLRGAA
jgi:integrase